MFSFNIPINVAKVNKIIRELNPKKVLGLERNQREFQILMVADKLETCQLLRDLLSLLGFQIKETVNGAEAIALWASWQSLILMDMRMPVMDGYQATKKIKVHLKEKIL